MANGEKAQIDLTSRKGNPLTLPFEQRRHGETFGQLVRSEHWKNAGGLYDTDFVRKIELNSDENLGLLPSPFRHEDGTFIQGSTAEEARLDPRTLEARVEQGTTSLPDDIANVINNNILLRVSPDRLRERAAQVFQSLDKEQIQKAPELALEADAFIAALFLQNYAHAKRALSELKKRVGPSFNPQSVLDVGYGPATGMVALNDVMGDDFSPQTKDVYVVGRANTEMKKRAKIILSRQVCEIPETGGEKGGKETEGKEEKEGQWAESSVQAELSELSQLSEQLKQAELSEQAELSGQSEQAEQSDTSEQLELSELALSELALSEQLELSDLSKLPDLSDLPVSDLTVYIGPVDASRIHIRSRIRDSLPSTKQYDLIIVNQALLTREYSFPKDVDTNIHMLLRLLKPDGHLVLVERGNALGFEIIARARQVMLRPEAFKGEAGKIPRPYVKGSSYKPQKIRKEDQLITDDHVRYEEALLARLEEEEREEERVEEENRTKRKEKKRGLKESRNEDLAAANETLGSGGHVVSESSSHAAVAEEDLHLELEKSGDFDVTPVETTHGRVDYHLSVVAPCPHHGTCPLQLGDPNLYKVSNHKHRLDFCSFNQVVHRPRYTVELKRGRRLATQWDRGSADGMGIDSLSKRTLKNLEGSGRPGGNNTESGNFSYLIMHRSRNDAESLDKIESDREFSGDRAKSEGAKSEGAKSDDASEWPRILEFPAKIKNNVKLKVCSPSGNVETWQVPKSLGKQVYHDARKVKQGDLWALDKKSVVVRNKLSGAKMDKLVRLASTQRKFVVKDKIKKLAKKIVSRSEADFGEEPMDVADELASELERSKKYRTDGKRARFDVNPRAFDGK